MWQLPYWHLTDRRPGFYDTESGSAIEQTAKVYRAMRDLIEEYNSFVTLVNKSIEGFELESKEDQEQFKKCITEIVSNYIQAIDIKIDNQDMHIERAIDQMRNDTTEAINTMNLEFDSAADYMKNNITETAANIMQEAIDTGAISIVSNYDPITEALTMIVTGGVKQ